MSQNAFMRAAQDGRSTLVFLLLGLGATVNLPDKDCRSALMWAARYGHSTTVKLLLDRGAKIDNVDKDGCTALMWASRYEHSATVKLLLDKGAKIDIADKDGCTALMWAARRSSAATVTLLLDKGALINNVDKDGCTALMWASRRSSAVTVKPLLDRGAHIEVIDKDGCTALMWAARHNSAATMMLLLNKGAMINIADKDGCTALIWASRTHCVKLLLDRGAQIDVADKDGCTALMWASTTCPSLVTLLLDRGAMIDNVDKDGCTALMWASRHRCAETMTLLLDREAIIDIVDKDGCTALIWASRYPSAATATLLLEKGAKIDIADKDGCTALMWASRNKCPSLVKLLLEKEAMNEIADKMGLSPSDCKESESQQRDTPFDLSAIQAAVDQAVLSRATASQTALMQAAADREIADNAVREMDTARRKAADQVLTYNAQLTARMLDCLSDSGPVSVPSSLINLWTGDFKNELYCGSSRSMYSGLVFAEKYGTGGGAGRRVAVKKIKSEFVGATSATVSLGESSSAEESMRREIDVQSCYHHANIIRLLAYCLPSSEDLQVAEERMKELSLVYEYAPLGGLDALLRDDVKAGKMKWQGRLKIATGVAKGLCCMHYSVTDSPAYHGDIRSGNIVLMDDYTPKIIGLGSCKCTVNSSVQDSSIHSESSHQQGTVEYMCPAYSSGEIAEYDAKYEVFSYGIVLLELLTGQLQGSLNDDGERLVLDKCLAENSTLPVDRRVEWPQGVVDDVVMLARECVAPYQKRIGSMMTVMRRMEAMSNKQYTSNTAELELLEENDMLLARLAALQLQLDISTKKATESTHTCMSCNDNNIPRSKGVFCSSRACPHFFCGSERKGCVSKMLSSQFNDITPHLASKSCAIQCVCCTAVTPEAASTFDLSDIARQSSRIAFSAYMNAVVGLERHEAVLAREELRSHFASEMQIHSALYLKDTTPVQ